jgi:hypothetical protein
MTAKMEQAEAALLDYIQRLEADAAQSRQQLNVVGLAAQAFDAGHISALEFATLAMGAIFPEVK